MSDEIQGQTHAESMAEATRDDLIAAVREAGGAESADVAAEEAAAQAAPATEPTPAEPAAEEEPRIAQILKAREKAAAERESARNHANEILEEARREAEKIREETRKQIQQEAEAEREQRRQRFRASPIAAVRELGDPQEVSDAIMRDGTPEARAVRELQARLDKTEQTASEGAKAKEEIAALRKQVADQEQARQLAQVQEMFVGQYATAEKAPYMHAEYGSPAAVFAAANAKAIEWNQQGLQLHRDFDMNDVAQYVERETKQRFEAKAKALGLLPAQQAGAAAPATGQGNAPKVSANGPRTLSAAQGSERRTSPKPLSEMKPEEARAALIEEAAAARRANPDAPF